ncbi:hypothetical protein [Methanobrevibacter sp.]
MPKTYEATNQEEVEAIIMQIMIKKVREIVGNKPIRVIFKGDVDEAKD